jgi:hypothetical protein
VLRRPAFPRTPVDRSAAATHLLRAGFVHLCVSLESKKAAWSYARAVFREAARADAIGAGMGPLGVVGEFTLPPPGARRRYFQALHIDYGLPVVPAGLADVARFTALYVDQAHRRTTAATRIVPLRALLAQRAWAHPDVVLERLRGYALAADSARRRSGHVEGILARLVEAADDSPTLPRSGDVLCGMEFHTLGEERDHFAERGLDLVAVEQRVRLGPGQLLLLDNLATAHGRLGLRRPLELDQLCVGFARLEASEQSLILRRVLGGLTAERIRTLALD